MRQRLSVNEKGELVNREGEIVGRISSLTIELSGGKGGKDVYPSTAVEVSSDAQETLLPHGGVGENDAAGDVARVWAHYQAVVSSGSRYQIDSKRRSIIRNALKVRPLAEVLKAIDGLAASPHHNGQNDRRKKYLGINYALQGIGPESNDERIDKMAAMAVPTADGALAVVPSGVREMVRHRQRLVEEALLNPGDSNRAARAGDSERYLRDTFGLTAHLADGRVTWRRDVMQAARAEA